MEIDGTFLSAIYVEIIERARQVLGDSYAAQLPKVPNKERLSAKEVHEIWGRLDEIAPSEATGSEIGITLLPTPQVLEFMRHSARTRGDVLGGMYSYARLWGLLASTNQLEVTPPTQHHSAFKICPVFGPGRRSRIAAQVTLGAVVCGMRAMSTRPINVQEIHLTGSLSAEARHRISQIFGGQTFDYAERDALIFAAEVASYPSREPDLMFVENHESTNVELLITLSANSELATEVLKHIQRLIPAPNLKEVSKIMGLSERSLQRQLNEEGLTFRALARQGRLYLARSFLRSGCTVTESATLSGYSDISSFTRAYKARYGCTPGSDFRSNKKSRS